MTRHLPVAPEADGTARVQCDRPGSGSRHPCELTAITRLFLCVNGRLRL